ncbi:Pentatricopeptide repeat-containing protein [Heracleum sosnowskyi]|uniref:Pentatricopeptide repeat-containing protein n=1 Tax=Heracleum sosnowskyi TaxID=360622 RepID=A0AAD8LZG4_9APIA|nr:Pentatricopeptide repeat-containing protein [Heracleum sosnowskyi]
MNPSSKLHNTVTPILNFLQNCKTPTQLYQIQAQIITQNLSSNTNIAPHFITTCQSLGLLNTALNFYTHIEKPHVFICNTLIQTFCNHKLPKDSIFMYTHMHKNSILPNNYTFPFVLKAICDVRDFLKGKCVHGQIMKMGHFRDVYVMNSLLNLYGSCGDMVLCEKLFDEMSERDVVSWTAMISGYREAKRFDDALVAFEQMQYAGVVPNRVTMVNALSACASFGAIDMGVWIHDFIRRNEWELDVKLGTCLVDMYGKCGKIEEGLRVFESMVEKNVFTWNALLKGLAVAKSGQLAVWWFCRMQETGVKPDVITLISVLCACVHSGLEQMGKCIFSSIIVGKYGFSPNVKHYACMIDLLARSGSLEHALKVIQALPIEPTVSMWGAFLAGCRTHGRLELSELAAWKLMELEPDNSAYYVVLSNIYAETFRWSDVEKVRMLMKERGLKKDLGSSSLELDPQLVQDLLA